MMISKPEKLDHQLRLAMTKTERGLLDEMSEYYGTSRNLTIRQLLAMGHQMMLKAQAREAQGLHSSTNTAASS